jgi:hypothetical protein
MSSARSLACPRRLVSTKPSFLSLAVYRHLWDFHPRPPNPTSRPLPGVKAGPRLYCLRGVLFTPCEFRQLQLECRRLAKRMKMGLAHPSLTDQPKLHVATRAVNFGGSSPPCPLAHLAGSSPPLPHSASPTHIEPVAEMVNQKVFRLALGLAARIRTVPVSTRERPSIRETVMPQGLRATPLLRRACEPQSKSYP